MTGRNKNNESIRKLVTLAILAAIIVVLQCFCSVLTIPGFNVAITLTLVPILVGVAMYGVSAGAILGAVFGIIVLITDPTAKMLMQPGILQFIATSVLCIGKGVLAGALAGLVYKLVARKSDRSQLIGIILAGIAAPVANTGTFILGMLIFFKDTIFGWSAGSPSFAYYVIVGLCGINFVVELVVNLVLSTAISTIVKAVKKSVRG